MVGVGKRFEDKIMRIFNKNDIYYQKFRDFPGIISGGDNVRFTPTNPYDMFYFWNNRLYCIELKSTDKNRLSIGHKRMIKPHQVKGLWDAYNIGSNSNKQAGFLIEFRGDNSIWFIHIMDFLKLCDGESKSIGKNQIMQYGLRLINISYFFKEIEYFCINRLTK